MKKFRGSALVAGLTALAISLSGCAAPGDLTPTESASEDVTAPLITVGWNDIIDNFNSSSAAGNNVANSLTMYLTQSSFNYYDNTPALVKNTEYGNYEIVKQDPLTVKYTINDGVVWSDGTQIDGADMMLAWATIFGYFKNADDSYMFAHAAPKDNLASKVPTVEGNTITFEYDKQYVDWELAFGVGVAAHGAVMMAYPEITDPAEAKAKLIEAVQNNDAAWMEKVAKVWNEGYQSANTPDNPLVSLSSGPYVLEELVEEQYATHVLNPLYTWGPKPKYERVTIRQIADSTAAIQAVDNGEVQIASGQPTADVLALVQGLANADYESSEEGAYEHIDLTVNNGGPFDPATYGGDAEKAKLVRQAFLLSIPRSEIIDKLIKPLNPNARLRSSVLFIPGAEGYEEAEANYSLYLNDDETNRAKAKELLAQAGVTGPIEVGFWFPEGNVRRQQQFELIKLSADSVGFNVVDESEPDWVFTEKVYPDTNPHDATIFAWAATSLSVTGDDQYLVLGGPSNWTGYDNAKVKSLLDDLAVAIDPAEQLRLRLAIEAELANDAYNITIFQFPGLTWWDKSVSGVSSNLLVPYFFWNFWNWTPVAG
ncbi:MAG: ABC transporter family substrate-binding protein [Actinobacteria bacterium]|nr:ABC transporter family substrate-binding protein [Actinomycetota bacterium]